MTPAEAKQILDQHFAQWVRDLALDVTQIGTERAILRMPLGAHLMRVGGIVSGQALAALADTAMVLAALARQDSFRPLATTDLHVQFLRPGTGTAVLCDAQVVRAGRALTFARAEMRDETSAKQIAVATATFYAP